VWGRARDIPCPETLYKWAATFPAFAREVAGAYDFQAWMAADRRLTESPYYETLFAPAARAVAAQAKPVASRRKPAGRTRAPPPSRATSPA